MLIYIEDKALFDHLGTKFSNIIFFFEKCYLYLEILYYVYLQVLLKYLSSLIAFVL
jgi:hypothetical protein